MQKELQTATKKRHSRDTENDYVLGEAGAVAQEELHDAAVAVQGGRVDGGEAARVLLVDDVLTEGGLQQALTRLVVAAPGGKTDRLH